MDLTGVVVGVCSDGATAMTGKNSGAITLIKQKAPNAVATHCMLYREAVWSSSHLKSISRQTVLQMQPGFANLHVSNFPASKLY